MNRKTIKKLLLDTIGDYSNKTILDLGCGIGCFTIELAKKADKTAAEKKAFPETEGGNKA